MLPEAFLERMKRQLGDEYERYLDSLNRSRAVALRFNPLKGEIPQLPFVGQPVPWEPMGYYYDPDARPGLHVFMRRASTTFRKPAPWHRWPCSTRSRASGSATCAPLPAARPPRSPDG